MMNMEEIQEGDCSSLQRAKKLKDEGSNHFKQGHFELAISKYTSAIKLYDSLANLRGKEKEHLAKMNQQESC